MLKEQASIERRADGRSVAVVSPRRGLPELVLVAVVAAVVLATRAAREIAAGTAGDLNSFLTFVGGVSLIVLALAAFIVLRWRQGPRIDEIRVEGDTLVHRASRGGRVLSERTADVSSAGDVHLSADQGQNAFLALFVGRRHVVTLQMGGVTRFVGENLPEEDAEELRVAIERLVRPL